VPVDTTSRPQALASACDPGLFGLFFNTHPITAGCSYSYLGAKQQIAQAQLWLGGEN